MCGIRRGLDSCASGVILDEGGLQPPGRADIGNNPAVAVFICEIKGVEPL